MQKVKFKEIFSFEKKSKIKAGDGFKLGEGKYPFYTSSDTLSKTLNEFLFEDESLIFGTGGLASIHYCNEKFAVSTDCFVTQAKDYKKTFAKFVYYYLSGNMHLLENGFKGAGLKHISKDYIENLEIPLPPLPTQQKIAEILNTADQLRQYNKQLIEKYDALTQSLFGDMFGNCNPERNKWDEVKIENIVKSEKGSMRSGPFGSDLLHSEFVEKGIPVLGIDNAVLNKFQWKQRRYITEEKYQKLKRYTVYPRDIIITIMGTVGRVAVVPDNIGIAINTKHLAAISLNPKVANPEFIAFSLHSDLNILSQINQKGKGAIMTGLNLTIIKELKLKLPPLDLQNQFAERLQIIQTQKQQAQEALTKSEDLYQGLLQKAFKGELL
jgi:type I restriction enzyme S subunit